MENERQKRILFLVPYPEGQAGSQRFRFEQYFETLIQNKFQFDVSPFLSLAAWRVLYRRGFIWRKVMAIASGYFRRIRDLVRMGRYDFVFIHREASPFGPPWIEWIAMRLWKKYTIFDFDDAIWLSNTSESNWITKFFKRYKNANDIIRWATVISAGNQFLASHARQYNASVLVNPTTIDTDEHHNEVKLHGDHRFTIGWTGSHSTVQFLDELLPVLQELEKKYEFEFHVIADFPPKFKLNSLKFIRWTKENEIRDLLQLNVGIMPLPDNVWTRGKCGFKALQYMALGIPAVVSNVGVNGEIVDHEVNGCVCNNAGDWYTYLSKLMSDPGYLIMLSRNTREKIVTHYSVRSNRENFLRLFQGRIDS